jgi:hypothetical protein
MLRTSTLGFSTACYTRQQTSCIRCTKRPYTDAQFLEPAKSYWLQHSTLCWEYSVLTFQEIMAHQIQNATPYPDNSAGWQQMTILIPGASLNPWLPGLYFPAKKNCTNTANAAFSRAMVILHLFLVPKLYILLPEPSAHICATSLWRK